MTTKLSPTERERLRRQGIAASVDPSERFGRRQDAADAPDPDEVWRAELRNALQPIATLIELAHRLTPDDLAEAQQDAAEALSRIESLLGPADGMEPCAACGSSETHPRAGCYFYRTPQPPEG